ncbi:Iron transport multicopper oxidase fetC [Trichinella spiralis]|uniref:Iron transport multicopper oxidase fetC n=1 Tax=Trichinella spiralis TaxID=6334 RepID=A0ABR3K2E1_TRISP
MKLAEKPLVSKKRSKSNEAPYDGLAIHELPEVSYQATGWLFSNQQKHMKLAEKPLVSKKRSKSNEAPYDGLAIHELPEVSYQATGWLFSNQQKHYEAC